MTYQPEKITKNHVLQAVKRIDDGEVVARPSTRYDVIINGKAYPPKDLLRLAHEHATGEYLWKPFGGEPTNKYLKQFGFEIKLKNDSNDHILNLIKIYKERVRKDNNSDEIYKFNLIADFQLKWEIDANDFPSMLKKINFSNLLYFNAIGVIRDLAIRFPEEVRSMFKALFNEDIELEERIKTFQSSITKLYATINSMNHHQDERTIATYLTFNDPSKYTFYKSSFYSKYCDLLNIKKAKSGNRYIHYLQLVDQFIEDFIEEDKELQQLHSKYLQNANFKDEDFKILAQDILYQSLDLTETEIINYYVAGSVWKGEDNKSIDQLTRFLKDGIWENGHDGKNTDIVKSIKPGSKIAIKAVHTLQKTNPVMTIKARGEVLENEDDGHILKVNWEEGLKPFIVNFNGGYWQTVHQVTNQAHIDAIFNTQSISLNSPEMSNAPLNQILFGPPGTGKTYNTIDTAVNIISGKTGGHIDNKFEFDKFKNEGQIEFITFHQSYSYEDFMVGLRPDAEEEILRFKPYKGIFYQIAQKAKENYLAAKGEGIIAKDFEAILTELLQPIESGQEVEIKMASGISFYITDVTNSTIRFRKHTHNSNHTLSIETLKEIVQGTRTLNSGLVVYYNPLAKLIKEKQQTDGTPKATIKRYVLIIDEINRANISKVFGELITLLEDDKRLGADNELTITLPNGERNFGVPPNLYVIGTMNTADKSIALLDIALRRRFEFVGKYPDYDILKELRPESIPLIKSINASIYKKKKTADYLIGHAYFLSNDSLQNILLKKVIPLLNEYFNNRIDDVSDLFKDTGWNARFNDESYCWEIEQSKTEVND